MLFDLRKPKLVATDDSTSGARFGISDVVELSSSETFMVFVQPLPCVCVRSVIDTH